jgi:hypothetical protein
LDETKILDTYVRVTSIKSSSTFKVDTKVTPCANCTACLLHYIDKKTGSYRSARVFLSNVASEDDDANQTGADLSVTEDRVRALLTEMFKEHTRSTVGKEYKSGDRTLMTVTRFQLEEDLEDMTSTSRKVWISGNILFLFFTQTPKTRLLWRRRRKRILLKNQWKN